MPLNYFHRAPGRRRLLACLLMGAGACIAPAQSVKAEPNDAAALRAEVQRLALEVLQVRAELIQWKMDSIRAELQRVQAERQRVAGERRLIEREIGHLDQAATKGPGAEDQARREELNDVQLREMLATERTTAAREATLIAALSAESARMNEIQKQVERQPASQLPVSK